MRHGETDKPDTAPKGDDTYWAYKREWRPGGKTTILADGRFADCKAALHDEALAMHRSAQLTEAGQNAQGMSGMATLDMIRPSYPFDYAVDMYGYTLGVSRTDPSD